MKEDVVGLLNETIEDTMNEIASITALFRIRRYKLNETITTELDFILGAVLSQIINRFSIYRSNRSIKISEDDLNELYNFLFSKSEEFKNIIQKSIDS